MSTRLHTTVCIMIGVIAGTMVTLLIVFLPRARSEPEVVVPAPVPIQSEDETPEIPIIFVPNGGAVPIDADKGDSLLDLAAMVARMPEGSPIEIGFVEGDRTRAHLLVGPQDSSSRLFIELQNVDGTGFSRRQAPALAAR